jgi:hypothetical protein
MPGRDRDAALKPDVTGVPFVGGACGIRRCEIPAADGDPGAGS